MKASIKFRDEHKPLFRAKVPLNVMGLPFQSGIVAGESKELCLNLGTFFESGPSFKIAYRPNDSLNPFSLVFKTGIGRFGSPISSSMTMSAEFNLIGNQTPLFFVHFKPRIGDFAIKKSQSSEFVKNIQLKSNGAASDDDTSIEVIETPVIKGGESTENGFFYGKKIPAFQSEARVASMMAGLLRGMEVSARTVLPVRQRAVVNFRWGLRFQGAEQEGAAAAAAATATAMKSYPTAGISFEKFPLLVMNKIGIEHLASDDSKDSRNVGPAAILTENTEMVESYLAVRRQMGILQAENGMLRKAMDDLRSHIAFGKSSSPSGTGMDMGRHKEGEAGAGGRVDRRSSGDKRATESNALSGKAAEGDVNEELKKALMGTSGA